MNLGSVTALNNQSLNATKQADQQNNLGKDAFLKILVTQMQNQNPLEPMKDTEFIGQMAQFSSLEQLTNLNEKVNQILEKKGAQ